MARTKKLTDYVYSPTDPASEDAIRAQIDDSIQEVYDQSAQTADVVLLTTDQTVAGIKTFSSSPIVPTPVLDYQSATKKYIDDVAAGFVLGEVSDNSITPTKLTPLSRTLFTNKSYLNSGTANALVVATDGEADYTVDNWIVSVIPSVNNTGTITLNVDGKGVKNVKKVVDGAYVDLEADDIEALKDKSFRWSVSNDFFVKAPSSSGGNIAWLQIYDSVEGNNIIKDEKDKDVVAKAGQYLYSEFYALKVGTQIIPPTTQATSASDLLVLADGTVEMANPEQDQVYQGFISDVDLWNANMEGANSSVGDILYGTDTLSVTETTINVPIGDVDDERSMIYLSLDGGVTNFATAYVNADIVGTNLVLSRNQSGSQAITVSWLIVPYENIKSFQKGTYSYDLTLQNIPISTVDRNKSIVQTYGSYSYTGDTPSRRVSHKLSTDSNLQLVSFANPGATEIKWRVLEFN